jgi:glycosyltransferase involved in cell wall biosynthesis
VIFDCERMKYPHTGLYHFCLQLGNHLHAIEKENEICFYVPPSAKGIFGADACYIRQHSLHKYFLPSTSGFQIWHSTYQSTNYFPSDRNIKIILTVHDLNFLYDEKKSFKKKKKYLDLVKERIERADHIVAISKFTLDDLKANFDLSGKSCSVIYNGCNIHETIRTIPPAILPQQSFLYTIGTIIEKKNFHVLPCLLVNNDYSLIISGITQSEEYKSRIIAEAKKYGIENRIVFTGAVSENDKQWYMENCTAFVFPSISEGFGLPVVEAMHFGRPTILSSLTSLPEIGGDAAYYFNTFNAADMQQVLKTAIEEHNHNNGIERTKNRSLLFSWGKSAGEYYKLYSQILNGNKET